MTAAIKIIEQPPLTSEGGRILAGVIDALPEGMVVQDVSGAVVDFNASALDVLGIDAEGLVSIGTYAKGRTTGPAPAYADLLALTASALSTGLTQADSAVRLRSADGQTRFFSIAASPAVTGSDAASVWIVTTFRDVTLEMRSRREREFARTLDYLPTPIAYFDAAAVNVHANGAYARFFGKVASEIKGKSLIDIIGPEAYAEHAHQVVDVLAGCRVSFYRDLKSPDGAIHHKSVDYVPEIQDGRVAGFFVFVADVTALRRAQDERERLEVRLIASSKMTLLGEMAGGIAHEINNPLAIIGGTAGVLKSALGGEGLTDESLAKGLSKIESTVHRIAQIIRGLRSFARDAEDDPSEVIGMDTVLDDTIRLCGEKLRDRGIALKTSVPPVALVECRPTQVAQILMNLIGNAVDAVADLPEKWIEVRAEVRGDRLCILVTDSGRGIPEAVSERMLHPFFTTKPPGRGTGLGLSIAKGLAESNGGQLSYDRSAANTCFVLDLPLSKR